MLGHRPRALMIGTDGLTSAMEPTWSVICESWVSSNSSEPVRLFMIRSPKRSRQVLSGM